MIVPANPSVLIWARTERGFDVPGAAKALSVDTAWLVDLEDGRRQPTLGELRKIAETYQFPLATLLMPEALPPAQGLKLADFRTFPGGHKNTLDTATLVAIDYVDDLIDGMTDLKAEMPDAFQAEPIPFYDMKIDAVEVAARERARFGVAVEEQATWENDREAFNMWRMAIEYQGVLTYQLKLGADNTRGFSVWDDRGIPAIVIDSGEGGYGAKIFTLFHEYCHVILRMTGVSDHNSKNRIEKYCNTFAANFLMPKDAFTTAVKTTKFADTPWSEWHLVRLAKRFNTSKLSVALHAENLGLAPSGYYSEIYSELRLRRPGENRGRSTHQERMLNRLGFRHVDLVSKALARGILDRLDAYELTAIRPKHFGPVMLAGEARRSRYGPGA